MEIRMANKEDAKELLSIYAPYCTDTVITFEYEVPSVEEFTTRIQNILKTYPYLVAVEDGELVGYAYASTYKERKAFQWSVETSIYVKQEKNTHGIGTLLYEKLLGLLEKQNVKTVFACISMPNEKSEAFHKKFGFHLVGKFENAGFKHGRWCDLGWFEKRIGTVGVPEKVIPIKDLDEV